MADDQTENGNSKYGITSIWGDQILDNGFTISPNLILDNYTKLGITPTEMMFIIHVTQHKWSPANPYPGLLTISSKLGIELRQVKRIVASIKNKGFMVVRERYLPGKGQTTNEYDFTPLREAVVALHRKQATPVSEMSLGGMSEMSLGRVAGMSPEEDEVLNKTNLEEDSEYSNTFELHTQVLEKASNLKFSKNEIEFLQNSAPEDAVSGDEPQAGDPDERRRGDSQPQTPSTNSFTAIGDVGRLRGVGTGKKSAPRSSKTAPAANSSARAGERQGRAKSGLPDPPEWLVEHITRLSDQLHDLSHAEGNIGQAYNLFLFTGAEEGRFQERLTEAKRLTMKYDIEKRAEGEAGELGQRNKMPYFFKVLRDVLGLKDIPASETKPKTARGKGKREFGDGEELQRVSVLP